MKARKNAKNYENSKHKMKETETQDTDPSENRLGM